MVENMIDLLNNFLIRPQDARRPWRAKKKETEVKE
jgi:hypothetical protein